MRADNVLNCLGQGLSRRVDSYNCSTKEIYLREGKVEICNAVNNIPDGPDPKVRGRFSGSGSVGVVLSLFVA